MKRFFVAFTLIELMTVVAIIALLMTFSLAAISTAQKRSRDAQRKAHLNVIAQAIDLYVAENRSLPTGLAGSCIVTSESQNVDPWIPGLTNRYYPQASVNTLPRDPKNSTTRFYTYKNLVCLGDETGKSYELSAQLENRNDPDGQNGVYKVVR